MKGELAIDWSVSANDEHGSFRWGYLGEDVVAEWAGVLTLRASRRGELKSLQAAPGASPELVEKTRLGVASAFLRAQRRQLSLHASAVSWRGEALVCLGASGQGKSTVAERLCRHGGGALLADDLAAVELLPSGDLEVLPSERILWLDSKGSTGKTAHVVPHVARAAARLRCVVALAFDGPGPVPEVRSLHGADAVSAVLPSLIRFEATPFQWERELEFVTRLVSQAQIVRASRSREVSAEMLADTLVGLAPWRGI
jgi:hypothetical protein